MVINMKWKPAEDAQKGSGPFFFRIKDQIVTIWLGGPIEPDREFVMQFHADYLLDIIATLKMIERKT